MERSNPHDAFDPIRNTGLMYYTAPFEQRMTFASGIFRTNSDNASGNVFDYGDGEYAYTSRVTFLPWYENEGRCWLHLGGAHSYRMLDPDVPGLGAGGATGGAGGSATGANPSRARFSSRIPLRVGSPNVVDTGELRADRYQLLNLQSALTLGPFSVQGEYYYAQVNELRRGPRLLNPAFDGFYVQAS